MLQMILSPKKGDSEELSVWERVRSQRKKIVSTKKIMKDEIRNDEKDRSLFLNLADET